MDFIETIPPPVWAFLTVSLSAFTAVIASNRTANNLEKRNAAELIKIKADIEKTLWSKVQGELDRLHEALDNERARRIEEVAAVSKAWKEEVAALKQTLSDTIQRFTLLLDIKDKALAKKDRQIERLLDEDIL